MSRSLLPREHGAYFQLGVPLATACLARTPTAAALALAAGATLAFLANEALLVALGHRGPRRKQLEGARATRLLGALAGAAVGLGVLGLVLAPRALAAAAIVAVPTGALVGCALRRAEHTLAGELVAAFALTGASVPVLVASGAPLTTSLELWLAWGLGFAASVLAVHRVIARHKRAATRVDTWHAVGLLACALAAASGARPLVLAAPLVALSALLVIAPPSAKRLRAIGVAVALVSLVIGGLIVNS